MCHSQCIMDGITGQCHTAHCGTGSVGCCKRGLVQLPCDGIIGCSGHQCCTAVPVPSGTETAPSPPPLGLTLQLDSGVDEDLAAAATWNAKHHCTLAKISYDGKVGTDSAGGFQSSSALVSVTPWQEALRVVMLFKPHGYVEVMNVGGAALLSREQVGAWLRMSFVLDDEPAEDCTSAACFTIDAIGAIGNPESIACNLPDDLIDPPPSPPPRYISKGELFARGELSLGPPPPPPLPPLLSTGAVGRPGALTQAAHAALNPPHGNEDMAPPFTIKQPPSIEPLATGGPRQSPVEAAESDASTSIGAALLIVGIVVLGIVVRGVPCAHPGCI